MKSPHRPPRYPARRIEAIRHLVSSYNVYADLGAFADVVELFHEDATMSIVEDGCERLWTGPDGLMSMLHSAKDAFQRDMTKRGVHRPQVRHFLATQVIEVLSRRRARGSTYVLVVIGDEIDHWGRYLDEFRYRSGRWRFQQRRAVVDGRSTLRRAVMHSGDDPPQP